MHIILVGSFGCTAITSICTNQTYPVDFQKAELKLRELQELCHFVRASLANWEFSRYARRWLLGGHSSDTTESLRDVTHMH